MLYITEPGRVSWHNGYEWVCHKCMMHVALLWLMSVSRFGHVTSFDDQKQTRGFDQRLFKIPSHLSFNSKGHPSSGSCCPRWVKLKFKSTNFCIPMLVLHRPISFWSDALSRACLSSNCQSRCQEGWWTILSATDDRWRGLRGACWVHVKGSASKGLLWRCYGDKAEEEVVYDGRWWVVHTRG